MYGSNMRGGDSEIRKLGQPSRDDSLYMGLRRRHKENVLG